MSGKTRSHNIRRPSAPGMRRRTPERRRNAASKNRTSPQMQSGSSNSFVTTGRRGCLPPQKGKAIMRSNFAILALLLAATMAAAQMRPPQGQSPNPYGQIQPQSGPQNQAPSDAPSPSSGKQQAPSSTASGHKLLQAKSQDE